MYVVLYCIVLTMVFFLLSLWLKRLRRRSGEDWVEQTAHALAHNDPALVSLTIHGERLSEAALRRLCFALRDNYTLQVLSLQNMHFDKSWTPQWLAPALRDKCLSLVLEDCSDDEDSTLAETLTLCRNLYSISIRSCELEPSSAWGELLDGNEQLKELRISYCHSLFASGDAGEITEDDSPTIRALSKGLANNHMLQVLELSGNSLDDDSILVLSQELIAQSTDTDTTSISGLTHVSLDFNAFSDNAVSSLSHLLMQPSCYIKELSLFGNQISPVGAESLATALYENTCLTSLILSLNQIGDSGVAALARALTVNTTLQNLWIPSNLVGLEGMQVWGDLLPHMRGLEQLNVGMILEEAAADALCCGLKTNVHLNTLHMEMAVQEFEEESSDVCYGRKDLDFWLRLNRSGRRLLLQTHVEEVKTDEESPTTSLGLCAKLFAQSVNHSRCVPDVLYYMLKERPDLVTGG